MKVKKRVGTVIWQGSFNQRVVIAWNGLPGMVVAAEKVDKFKLEFDRYLEVMGMLISLSRRHTTNMT